MLHANGRCFAFSETNMSQCLVHTAILYKL